MWRQSNEEGSDGEGDANLYLVAQEEFNSKVYHYEPSLRKLQNAYDDLHIEFMKLVKEVVVLRKKNK